MNERHGPPATIFSEQYVTARQHPEYVRQKKLHKEKYEEK
jgi:hypothetical protein